VDRGDRAAADHHLALTPATDSEMNLITLLLIILIVAVVVIFLVRR
jgi:hypothetical protein